MSIDEALAELNLTRSVKQRSWSFQHAADLAVHSDMLVVLPERLARLRQDGMYRPMPLDIDGLNSSIIWHASRTGDKAHLWLRQELIRSFRE